MKAIRVNLGKVSITVHGKWENKDYDKLSLVYSEERNSSYISKRPVPAGTFVTDENYWTLIVQGGNVDTSLSNYYTKSEIDILLEKSIEILQNNLKDYVKTSDFKTINGESIIGEGDIKIESTDTSNCIYKPTIDESTQITTNIGAIKAGTTLEDLKGKTYSEIIDAMLIEEVWDNPNYTHIVGLNDIPSIVKVGTNVTIPTANVQWNSNIKTTAVANINYTITKAIPGSSVIKYNKSGTAVFTMNYSYPEGYYTIKSNLGNTKDIIVPAYSSSINKIVDITYPWFINDTTQNLVKIGISKTFNINLTGSPVIKVPFENSEVTIQADLGFGYMDVDWIKTIDNTNLGNAIDETVSYQVFTKPDSYTENIPHKITIKLIK